MADAIVRLRVESSEFDQKLSRATQQLQHMEKEVRRTGATFAYADKEEIAFIKSLGSMETKTTSAKSQLREYTEALMQMTSTYRSLTQEEKNSDWGKALAASMDQIKEKAAMLKDAMSDVNLEISGMASDTSTFDALSQGFTSIVSVIQVGMGAMQAFGVKNEEAMEAMARLQAVMAVTSGAIKIQNALQKQSAMMVGVATLQKKAAAAAEAIDTAAKGKNIAVTTAATVAQKALNAVASANPYMLLATAIASVTAAVVGFSMAAKNAEKESNGLSNALKAQAQAQQEAQKSIAQVTGLYNRLKIEWQNLTTEQEKNNWIEENKSSFESLGLSIRNVVDADRAFVTMSDQVVAALRSRAKANALQELYENKTREAVEASLKVAKFIQPAAKNAGDTIKYNPQDWQSMGLSMEEGDVTTETSFQQGYGSFTEHKLTEQGAAKVNAYYAKKAEEDAARISKQYIEEVDKIYGGMMVSAIQEASANESALGALGSGKTNEPTTSPAQGNAKTEEKAPEGSIKAMREQLSGLQKDWELATDDDSRKVLKDQIDEVSAALDKMIGKTKEAKPALQIEGPSGYSEEGISALRSEIQGGMKGMQMGSDEYMFQAERLVDLTTFEDLMKTAVANGIKIDPAMLEGLFEQIDNATFSDNALELVPSVSDEEWQKLVDTINEQLANLGLDPITLDVKPDSIENAEKDMDKLKTNVEGAIGVFGQLGGAMQQLEDPGAKVAGIIMEAIASVAGSFAKSLMGAVGPWDWIAAAIGGVSTMISTIAAIKSATSGSYASGGIIPGNSFSGDNLTANVNSGELILNRAQQGSIASQLQGAAQQTVMVEGRISGKDILLSANNTNRAAGGSRGYYTKVK